MSAEPSAQSGGAESAHGPGITSAPKLAQGRQIVRGKLFWAMGAGMVPLPFVDVAGIAGVQLKMISDLSRLYGVKFSEHKLKNLIAPYAGSVGTVRIGSGAVASILKSIPIVGQATGAATLPIIAGASTYALGRVFLQHFESGGTFLDFDPEKTKAYFEKFYAEGKAIAEGIESASEDS